MQKDFDRWNELQKKIHSKESCVYCNTREIWWASLGLNIGSEEDGKHELFERPVLIIKVFHRNAIRILPLTNKIKNDRYHVSISYNESSSSVILSQLKTISTKRLSRKVGRLEERQFNNVINALKSELV